MSYNQTVGRERSSLLPAEVDRRSFLKGAALAAAAGTIPLGIRNASAQPSASPHKLPPLPYPFDALEPYIDAQTMEIHHDKHHQAYVNKLNAALEGTRLGGESVETLIANLDRVPENVRMAVRNNGGGHANHSLFWQLLKKDAPGLSGDLKADIDAQLGGYDKFKDDFSKAAIGRFGSGWAWLSVDKDKRLVIESTPNQDSPLMTGNTPILGLDVWEHAYYLKYQNRRPEYVEAFFSIINWPRVAERYVAAIRA